MVRNEEATEQDMDTIGGAPGKAGSLVANDVLVLLAFVAAVVGVLMAGILIGVRVRARRRHERDRQVRGEHLPSGRRSGSGGSSRSASPSGSTEGEGEGRRRVRRRRRDHRPRNPSLAESGGLPPEREPGEEDGEVSGGPDGTGPVRGV